MPAIRSSSEIAKKWADVTPGRGAQYTEGVKNPRKDWQQATAASEDRYNRGVQEAIGRGAFGKGVGKTSTAEWQKQAVSLGSARFGPGVSAAKEKYLREFDPYRNVIESTTLPPRGPVGDPANINRVVEMARALHAAKTGA